MQSLRLLVSITLVTAAGIGVAQQVDLGSGSVVETASRLRTGQYVWAPQLSPTPGLLPPWMLPLGDGAFLIRRTPAEYT